MSVIAFPGSDPVSSREQIAPHECVVNGLKEMLKLAESGELRSFVLVGETADGRTKELGVLCEADLHVIDSILGMAQRRIQDELMSGCECMADKPPA